MQIQKTLPTLLAKSFLWVWAALCVLLFIVYPGSISHVHQFFSFLSWQDTLLKITKIEPVYYLGNLTGSFIGLMMFFLAYTSLGILCLKLVGVINPGKIFGLFERLAILGTAFLLGREILCFVFLLFASIYQITPAFVVLTITISFLAGIHPFILFLLDGYRQDKNSKFFETTNAFDKSLLLLAMLIMIVSLMYSSSRLSYDSVGIYFSNAKITAMTEHIQFFSNEPLTASAFQDGIQYAAIIQVFGDQAARMYSWINGIVIIILSLALAEKLGLSKRARIILLVLLLTSTAFLDLTGDGKIDLASSAPIIAVMYWMAANYKERSKIIFLLIGFLAGVGMISRPYNIFLVGLFIGLFYALQAFSKKEHGGWHFNFALLQKPVIWIAPGIILLFAYLLFTNWIIAGDPLAPLLGILNYKLSNWDWPFDPKDIWKIRLLYLFVVTFSNSSHGLGTVSPLFLAFLPGLLIADIRKKMSVTTMLKQLILVTLITLILWLTLFFTVLEIRYIFFLWIIIFMLGAQIIESALACKELLFQKLVGLTMLITLSYVAFRTTYISLDTYSPVDKQGVAHCYDSFLCTFLEPVNQAALPGDRVLALNAYRYYLRSDLFACSSKREEYLILEKLSKQKSEDFWTEVYRQGYKFVTYEQNYSETFLHLGIIPDPKNTPSWLKLKPIYHPNYQINGEFPVSYQIIVTNPPFSASKICKKEPTNQKWEVVPFSTTHQ